MPDVRCGHRDVFGEAAVPVDANDLRVRTHVRVAGATEQASSIDDVTFRCYAIAFAHIGDERTDLHHFTGELVTDDERRNTSAACPRVPFVNVDVGAAHSRSPHANQHFILTNRRLSDVFQYESRSCRFFYERFHAQSAPFVVMRFQCADGNATRRARTETSHLLFCDGSATRAHLLRAICVLPIFAMSDCSHRTRVLRGSTATKVLALDVELCGEYADRRWTLCPPPTTISSSVIRAPRQRR